MDDLDNSIEKVIGYFEADYRRTESRGEHLVYVDIKTAKAILDLLRELLKEPEPKVLTVEELRQLPAQTIVWTEYWNGEDGKASDELLAAMKCYDGTFVDEDASVYSDFDKDMTPDRFDGSYWRFWYGKPTEEQRKAVPWE